MLIVFILRFKLDAFLFLRLPQNSVYLTPLQDKWMLRCTKKYFVDATFYPACFGFNICYDFYENYSVD